jgi:signal transduction histidine kinase
MLSGTPVRGLPARWNLVTIHIVGEPFGTSARFFGSQQAEWSDDIYGNMAISPQVRVKWFAAFSFGSHGDTRMPRFRLTILFVAVSAILILGAWAALGRISTRIGEDSAVGIGEELAEADARLIAGAYDRILINSGLAEELGKLKLSDLTMDMASMGDMASNAGATDSIEDVDPRSALKRLQQELNLLFGPVSVHQMALHTADGAMLWSSGASHEVDHSNSKILMGAKGEIDTELIRGVTVHSVESTESIDILDSYVPLTSSVASEPNLVFHISRDVTELVATQVSETRSAILAATMFVLGTVLAILGVFVFLADVRMKKISDRMIESLEQLDIAKNEFLSGLSHELKTPLTAMLGFTQILSRNRDNNLTQTDLNKLDIIGRNGRRLDALIGDLLDLAQIQSTKIKLEYEIIGVTELIDEISTSFEQILLAKNQSLVIEEMRPPAWISGDRGRLLQVLSNIVSNASKYSPADSRIFARCETASDRLIISITDEGPGINKEDQEKLFSLFYRTDAAEHSSTPGTGIGLYVCEQIIALHHGQITVTSEPGSGSTFTIELPGVQFSPPEKSADAPAFTNRLSDLPAAS